MRTRTATAEDSPITRASFIFLAAIFGPAIVVGSVGSVSAGQASAVNKDEHLFLPPWRCCGEVL